MDAALLEEAECYFAGGTAIVLALGEYRESMDIDFLTSSQSGYRILREKTFGGSLQGLFGPHAGVRQLREARSDQYGIRTQIGFDDVTIKFEIVREARTQLSGQMDATLSVPILSRDDMYCEKLLANADRWNDRSVMSRDIIDLCVMQSRWGPVPENVWRKAESAYGATVLTSYDKAMAMIADPEWLSRCAVVMAIETPVRDDIAAFVRNDQPKANSA